MRMIGSVPGAGFPDAPAAVAAEVPLTAGFGTDGLGPPETYGVCCDMAGDAGTGGLGGCGAAVVGERTDSMPRGEATGLGIATGTGAAAWLD